MNLSRRNTVVGLGVLLAGGGVITGVGAFDTVDADRDVTVEFEDDSDAILGMAPPPDHEARSFVTVEADEDDGTIGITIDRVNRNSRTVIDDIVEFSNNGTREITDITVDVEDETENGILEAHDTLDEVTLGPGESHIGLGLTIDTIETSTEPDVDGTITIGTETEA